MSRVHGTQHHVNNVCAPRGCYYLEQINSLEVIYLSSYTCYRSESTQERYMPLTRQRSGDMGLLCTRNSLYRLSLKPCTMVLTAAILINENRAAKQAVCAAVADATPLRELHVITEIVGVSVDRLSEGRGLSGLVATGNPLWICVGNFVTMECRPLGLSLLLTYVWKSNRHLSERAKDSVQNLHDKWLTVPSSPCILR